MNKKEDLTAMRDFAGKIQSGDWVKLCEKVPNFMYNVEINNVSGCMQMALKYLPKNYNK